MTAKTTATAGKTVKSKTVSRKSSKAAKPASSKLTAAQKHTAHVKHEQHLAHEAHLTAIGKAPKVALARAGDHLPVCAFEAIARSLRLAGQLVHDDDVAGLWDLAGADPLGASVTAALDAARLHGLAGFRPQARRLVGVPEVGAFTQDLLTLPSGHEEAAALGHLDDLFAGDLHGLPAAARFGLVGVGPAAYKLPGARRHGCVGEQGDTEDFARMPGMHVLPRAGVHLGEVTLDEGVQQVFGHALILGIDVPGPHAVLATPDGWWSWGELHSPWPCRVGQAWAVSWS